VQRCQGVRLPSWPEPRSAPARRPGVLGEIDLRRRELTVFRQAGEGRFDDGRTLAEDDMLRSEVLPGLEVPVRELLVSDED
jgi:hypothetical protein